MQDGVGRGGHKKTIMMSQHQHLRQDININLQIIRCYRRQHAWDACRQRTRRGKRAEQKPQRSKKNKTNSTGMHHARTHAASIPPSPGTRPHSQELMPVHDLRHEEEHEGGDEHNGRHAGVRHHHHHHQQVLSVHLAWSPKQGDNRPPPGQPDSGGTNQQWRDKSTAGKLHSVCEATAGWGTNRTWLILCVTRG